MVPIPPDPSEMMQLFVIGVRGKTVVVHIHKDATVDDLLTKLSKENGIPASTMRIIYTTKELEYGRNKRLYEYGISNDANLFVTLRLLGGTSVLPPIPPPQKELDDAVELTDEPDMITWDDDPLGQRAKMPCGHAIGNAECSGEDHRLAILRNCPRKTVVGVENCPSRRACVTCGLLIEHEKFCKHMVCPCGQRFCFICLKPFKDGSYQCGAFNAKCKVAAVQTSIPGSE